MAPIYSWTCHGGGWFHEEITGLLSFNRTAGQLFSDHGSRLKKL